MLESGPAVNLGSFGVHYVQAELSPDTAAEIEQLGYRALWISGSRGADLTAVRRLLDATENVVVATGVLNIWYAEAHAVAETYHRVEAAYPARFLLGIGAGHPELGADFRSPYRAMIDYLDVLDEYDVPKPRRLLAALGPRMLQLAAERSAGAYAYLVTPKYTRQARDLVGPNPVLAVEHKVALGQTAHTRNAGRHAIEVSLGLANYRANLARMGFGERDVAQGGSDALIDALVAQGDAATAATQLRAQLDAGASHLVVHAVPNADRLATLAALAPQLGLRRG